jgi:hypothetical protein
MGIQAPWPDTWGPTREIRRYDRMRTVSCEAPSGPRVAVVADEDDGRIEAIVTAHERVDSPHVAKVVGTGQIGAGVFALFACDAIADAEVVAAELTTRETKIPYPAAIAFNEFLMDSVESVHQCGAGVLGAFSWRNIMVGPRGRLWLFGLGNNFPVRRADGSLTSGFGVVEAPEMLLGAPLSPASDVYLLSSILRSMLPYVELLPMFAEALRRADDRSSAIYAELVSAAAVAPDPSARIGTIAELRARYRAVRALAPEMPDPDEASLARLVTEVLHQVVPARGDVLSVNATTRTLEIDGESLNLSERAIQWRLMWRLVEAHASGSAVSIQELSAAGWPGEKVLPEAARARVYVTISNLRRTALRRCLQKRDEGYFLSPEIRVHVTR